MIRRSRISVRPNVKPTGRAAVTSREAPQGNEAPADLGANVEVKDGAQENVTDVKAASTVLATETNDNTESQSSDVTGQSDLSLNTVDVAGQSVSTSSLSMRRKRFSVLPNLSKPRSTPSSTLTSSKLRKSPARPVTTPEIPSASTHIAAVVSESPDKHEPTQEPAPELLSVSIKSVRSPAPKLPSSSVHSISRTSGFHTDATKSSPEKVSSTPESAPELPHAPLAPSEGKSKRRKPKPVTSARDKKETSSCRLDKAEPQSANQDASESSCPSKGVCSPHSASLSESLNEPVVQDGSDLSCPGESNKPQHVPLALRTLNDPVDRLRLARAKKLRELLKKEMKKEKKHQRSQTGISKIKKTKDHTKMTMRELIYYLPSTNPMKSHTEDEQRAEMDFPPSPNAAPAVQSVTEENAPEEDEEREEEEEEEPTLAPRVKVAEDGSLIIDEESLTVRVQRMKGPNPVEERDPIFERGSTTTYSSFRKGTYTKPWSSRETDLFFLAISMVGTDFSMIGQLFPHRARTEIKNKFKKEERANSWRIDKAFKEKRGLDLDFFSKLLAQILKNDEEKRKKKKRTSQMSKLPRRRPEERKRIYSSDSEEEESSSSEAMDGEKENEIACNDGGSGATPKRRRTEASKKRTEQEAEEEAERCSNEETSLVNELKEEEAESFGAKPPRRRRNGGPVVQRKAQDTHTSFRDEHTKETDTQDSSASVQEKTRHASDVVSCGLQDSENEEEPDVSIIQEHILNKPTRSGRIPKLSQQMIRAAADEEDNEEEEQLPTLPLPPDGRTRGSRAKRGRWCPQRQGKSRLLTLRASVAEDEDNVEEEYGTNQEEENYSMNAEEENQAFVPMGLRSVRTVQSEVEETMEELDISVNVPDVLGISQNAVCPESSCERALASMGSVPCEHQLDLLVGVIDILAPDDMEVSEEAARTLLTIGHSADVTQTGDLSSTGDVIIVEESSTPVQEVLMETMDQSETVEICDMVTSDPSFSIISQTDSVSSISMEDKPLEPSPLQDFASTAEPISCQESKLLSMEIQAETSNVTVPEPTASKTRRNHLPKPKPNLSRASKTTQRGPAEAVDSSTETCSTPVKDEAQISTAKVFGPEEPSHPGSEEQNSEVCKERENDQTEGCSSVVLLEKKMEDGDSGQRSYVEDVRKEETQQAHGDSEPRSSGSDNSVRPSQLVRRCRGPRAKPNLVRSVRTTHTVTHIQQNRPAVPDEKQAGANKCTGIQQPEEGANLGPEQERETPNNPVNPDDNPEEPPRCLCETVTSDEPVYILSLTEVLPTLTERAGLVTECLTLPATSGMISEPMNVIEDATADVGGAGPDGDQVISQLLPDALIPVSEEGDAEKRGNETSRRKEEESSSQLRRREHSPLTQNMPAPEGPDHPPVEHLASRCTTEENLKEVDRPSKRRNFPERGRRAKLQLEPNTIQRKNRRDLKPPDETRSAPASSRVTSEETGPHPTPSEITSSSASTEDSSSAVLEEEEEEALSSDVLDKNRKTSTDLSAQGRVIVPSPVVEETPPPQASSPSQGNVENINFPGTDSVEPGVSGVEVGSQPVHQTSTGPLTRPGRRPKGFLSFMSSANTQRPSESTRSTPPKPAVVASRRGRRQATPSTSTRPPPPPSPPPLPSASPLPSPPPQPPHVSSQTQAATSGVNPSAAEANEEPTSVSAYFFNDIFTVVEEQDELD